MTGADIIAIVVILTILVAIVVYLLHWLYRHSSKDQSFVRTGLGGEKVVMGGGALVIPIVHEITRVNMNAVPLEVRRTGEQSLITQNKMRIDLVCEFSVRVIPTPEGVSTAARTLGERTNDPGAMKEMVQGRLIDALATIAPTMTMEEVHANRGPFMERVAALVAARLGSNGLELENAALTGLNQSDISMFNPANAFDAEGLTQLTEAIEVRRQLRNQIENDARIAIKFRDYETEQRALEIDRDLELARIEQARAIETRRAAQQAEIEDERASSAIAINAAKVRAEQEAERIRIAKDQFVEAERITAASVVRAAEIERERETERADIGARRSTEVERLQSRRDVEAERIANERQVREDEIRARQEIGVIDASAIAEVDAARLEQERLVEARRIEVAKSIELLSLERERDIHVSRERAAAEQEKAAIDKRYGVDLERIRKDEELVHYEIAKNEKVKLAQTSAFKATEDASITANRDIDELRTAAQLYVERFEIERRKEVQIVDKERLIAVIQKSIEEAVAKAEAADAWKTFAVKKEEIATAEQEEVASRSKRIEFIEASSKADRDAVRITTIASAEKEAAELRAGAEVAHANAAAVRYEKEAEGQRRLNEAENMRSEASRRSAIYETLVNSLPAIIRETVKPIENIESIKILQVDGVPGLNSPSDGASSAGSPDANMTDRVVNSAMKYRTQVAFVDGLMKDLGLPLEHVGSAGGMSFRNFAPPSTNAGGDKEDS
ncbi:flotillin domain-containing protein [Acuticoccus sp.]|uniref:flotillin family protein n=1 Tax=Acuticoccus sp. TaxID=1904378 RepID=UPI003B5160CC